MSVVAAVHLSESFCRQWAMLCVVVVRCAGSAPLDPAHVADVVDWMEGEGKQLMTEYLERTPCTLRRFFDDYVR